MFTEQGAYELAKTRVEALQKELNDLNVEKNALAAREQDLLQRMNAWSTILRTEAPPIGPAPRLDSIVVSFAVAQTPEKEHGWKTKAAKDAVMATGPAGLTPKGLTDAVRRKGIGVSASFANNALARMKARKEVVEVDGRYYWHTFTPLPMGITFEEVKDQEAPEGAS